MQTVTKQNQVEKFDHINTIHTNPFHLCLQISTLYRIQNSDFGSNRIFNVIVRGLCRTYKFLLTDGTQIIQASYIGSLSQSEPKWLDQIDRPEQYHIAILHRRKNVKKQSNQWGFYIQKLERIQDHNIISFYLAKMILNSIKADT